MNEKQLQRKPASPPPRAIEETTLDPEDWSELSDVAHRCLDAMLELHRNVRDGPVWQSMPAEVRDRFDEPVPRRGMPLGELYEEALESLVPYGVGNIHPRFWGWVPGTGTAGGIIAEVLKAGMNTVPGAFDDVGHTVEQRVIAWMLDVYGFPADGSGILVSGGSVANFVALAAARDAMSGFDVAGEGLARGATRPVLYCSTETHNCVDKAVQLLGLGRASLRKIPVDADFRIRLDLLDDAIRHDRAEGLHPIAVVGNAGTVNTGATDPLPALADVAGQENLWFHVDGAFGALVQFSSELSHLVAGIDRADSLAFDLHKWMHVQYNVGCTIFRSKARHLGPFDVSGSYLSKVDRGPGAQPAPAYKFGPELSREAKGIKVWLSLKEHGLDAFGRQIAQNVRQAAYLSRLVEEEGHLELLAPTALNIVCFRYVPERAMEPEAIDRLNAELLMRLQEGGLAVPSHTVINGRFALRICITSHRTVSDDVDLVLAEILRLGRALEGEAAS
jgi:glutamate/tyrosine decarboxylase-like PLP-dependent enzyme